MMKKHVLYESFVNPIKNRGLPCAEQTAVLFLNIHYFLLAACLLKVPMASMTRITARMTIASAKISWK